MDNEALEKYFQICRRVYEQMERDGTWPWESDSPKSVDLIDSEDDQINP